jgi:Fur family transcriptional regulator, ferric uptake regulator
MTKALSHKRISGERSRGRQPRPPGGSARRSSLGDARDLLHDAGLRATAPRLAVLRMLLQERRPLSHSEISHALRDEGFDRVTVFRNLQDLAEASIVTRVDVGDHTWRFEAPSPESLPGVPHSHFVCERCNSVSCLNGLTVRLLPRHSEWGAIVGSISEVVLRGCCRSC